MTAHAHAPLKLVHDASRRPAPEPHGLRRAMRGLSGGVSVVTAGFDESRTGATVTSAQSFSTDPETMVVSINLGSSTWQAIRRHGHFCVNVLTADQRPVAERFSGIGGIKGPARYEGALWYSLKTGAPALKGALAAIDCELEEAVERHSHALLFGSVRAIVTGEGAGLVHGNGRYGTFAPDRA